MELTLDAAFSNDSAMGHAAYLLLVLSMLMRRMLWLRLLVIASALLAIAYASIILTDPVSTFWETLLVLVNIGQLSLTWWLDRRTQFDPREQALKDLHFPTLAPSLMRKLLRKGHWQSLPSGMVLTQQGVPVTSLWFLHDGQARVTVSGVEVAICGPGSFIGEMTVASAEPAFADVKLDSAAEVWRIDAATLRALAAKQPQIDVALQAAFFRTIRQRLAHNNSRHSGDSGLNIGPDQANVSSKVRAAVRSANGCLGTASPPT